MFKLKSRTDLNILKNTLVQCIRQKFLKRSYWFELLNILHLSVVTDVINNSFVKLPDK